MSAVSQKGQKVMRGIPVSDGVCHGKVLVLSRPEAATIPRYPVSEADIPGQIQRLEQAMVATRRQILEVQQKVRQNVGAQDAGIFDAHLLVLEDPALIDEVSRLVEEQKLNVEAAFHLAADQYVAALAAIGDNFLQARAADMRDVTHRVLNHLLGLYGGR